MIRISELEDTIFLIDITSPRELEDEKTFMQFMNALIKLDKFSILLSVEGSKAFSNETKKELGIWFKTHKAILKKNCQGFARITNECSKLKTLKSRALQLVMPCPYIVLGNTNAALNWAKRNEVI